MDAFERELVALRPDLTRYARNVARRFDVEDVIQDVMLRACAKRAAYKPDLPLKWWLIRMTRNVTIDHVRKEQTRGAVFKDTDPEQPVPEIAVSGGQFEREELLETLAAFAGLKQFSEQQRGYFFEIVWEEKTFAQVSRECGVPMGTLKTWTRKMRQSLQHELECATV